MSSLKRQFHKAGKPSIAVVGTGSLGRVVACLLSHGGHDVTLIGRDESVNDLRAHAQRDGGMLFRAAELDGDAVLPVRTMSYGEVTKKAYRPDILFYAVKAGYLSDVLQTTKPYLNDETKTVFLQGGVQWWYGYSTPGDMSYVTDPERIARNLFMNDVYVGLPNFGAGIVPGAPQISHLKSNAPITFGAVTGHRRSSPVLQSLHDLFNNGMVQPKITMDLFSALWSKAAGSFAMSSFALITGKTLGQMTNDPEIFARMVDSAETLQAAGRSLGCTETKNYADYLADMGRKLPNHMMTITRDPSEYDAIIGMPVRMAEAVGLNVSELKEIAQQSRIAADRILMKIAERPSALRAAPN